MTFECQGKKGNKADNFNYLDPIKFVTAEPI